MKSNKLIYVTVFLTIIFSISSCAPADQPDTFSFPDPMVDTEEGELFYPWTTLPDSLGVGNTRDCRMYSIPSPAPDWSDFLAHYKAELTEQGWVGSPTNVDETGSNEYLAGWINEESNTGVMIFYMPELFQGIVCVGNP